MPHRNEAFSRVGDAQVADPSVRQRGRLREGPLAPASRLSRPCEDMALLKGLEG